MMDAHNNASNAHDPTFTAKTISIAEELARRSYYCKHNAANFHNVTRNPTRRARMAYVLQTSRQCVTNTAQSPNLPEHAA